MKICIVCGKFCIIDWKIFINLLESLYSLWDSMCTLLESNRWSKKTIVVLIKKKKKKPLLSMVGLAVWCDWLWLVLGWTTWTLGLKLILFVSFLINFGLKNSNQIKFSSGRAKIFIKHGFLVLSYKCKQDRHWKLEIRASP